MEALLVEAQEVEIQEQGIAREYQELQGQTKFQSTYHNKHLDQTEFFIQIQVSLII